MRDDHQDFAVAVRERNTGNQDRLDFLRHPTIDQKVERYQNEISLAALIDNVNVRGRIIEYLIAGEDEKLRQQLVSALKEGNKGIPQFKTEHALGDCQRIFDAQSVFLKPSANGSPPHSALERSRRFSFTLASTFRS